MSHSEDLAGYGALQDWIRGTFYCHSAVTTLNLPYSSTEGWRGLLERRVDKSGRAYHTIREEPRFRLEDLDSLLVVLHERLHFNQLISTPLGLLQFRSLNCVFSQLQFLLRVFERHWVDLRPATPLLQWYGGIQNRLSHVGSRLNHPNPPAFVEGEVGNLRVLMDFWSALLTDARLSMRQFVDLANEARELLARISGCTVRATWAARDIDRSSYLPDHGLTTSELLEAQARLFEYACLREAKLSPDDVRAWQRRSLFGRYERAYNWALSRTRHALSAMYAIEIALCGPIDVSCGVDGGESLLVEDILPSWRLSPVIEAILQSIWPHRWEDITFEVNAGIASRAHLPTPESAIRSSLGADFSRWSAERSNSESLIHAIDHAEGQIRRGMDLRLKSLTATRLENMDPTIEFYSDRAVLNVPEDEQGARIAHSTIYHMAFMISAFSLLGDSDVSLLTRLGEIIDQTMGVQGVYDLQETLRSNLPNAFFRLLRW